MRINLNFEKEVELKNIRVKDVVLVPNIEIVTSEETMPMTDEEGHPIGVVSRIVTTKTLRLLPENSKEIQGDEENAV